MNLVVPLASHVCPVLLCLFELVVGLENLLQARRVDVALEEAVGGELISRPRVEHFCRSHSDDLQL